MQSRHIQCLYIFQLVFQTSLPKNYQLHAQIFALFILDRFPFDEKFWFEFAEITSDKWNSILQNFRKRGQPREVPSDFWKFPFHFDFPSGISRIFGRIVRSSEMKQFPDFLETFPRNCRTICPRLEFFGTFA